MSIGGSKQAGAVAGVTSRLLMYSTGFKASTCRWFHIGRTLVPLRHPEADGVPRVAASGQGEGQRLPGGGSAARRRGATGTEHVPLLPGSRVPS